MGAAADYDGRTTENEDGGGRSGVIVRLLTIVLIGCTTTIILGCGYIVGTITIQLINKRAAGQVRSVVHWEST